MWFVIIGRKLGLMVNNKPSDVQSPFLAINSTDIELIISIVLKIADWNKGISDSSNIGILLINSPSVSSVLKYSKILVQDDNTNESVKLDEYIVKIQFLCITRLNFSSNINWNLGVIWE